MPRLGWEELPRSVRDAVEGEAGEVSAAVVMSGGALSPVMLRLDTASGESIACKGIRADHPKAWMHRNELKAASCLPGLAPMLHWHVESDGWLMLGFEYIDGRAADLVPGSPDLPHVARAVRIIADQGTPCPGRWSPLGERWARTPGWRELAADPPRDLDPWAAEHLAELADREAGAASALAGDTLMHTDLCPDNILIGAGPHVIDWAWPARGPAWADTAKLVPRLILAGHTPEAAEAWAHGVAIWTAAETCAVTTFAVRFAGILEHRRRANPVPHTTKLAAAATAWARERLGRD